MTTQPCPTCGHTPCAGATSRIGDGERCVLNHRREPCRPRRTVPGLLVCIGHREATLRKLRQLAALDRILAARATAGGTGPRTGARSAELPIPVNDQAATMRRHIRRKLAGWIRIITTERTILLPGQSLAYALQQEREQLQRHRTLLATIDDPATNQQAAALYDSARTLARLAHRIADLERATDTAAIVTWLVHHHDWLLADPDAADDYADELAELHTAAWQAAYPEGRRRIPVGRCPIRTTSSVATREEQQCPGTVTGTIRPSDDLLPTELVCDRCGTATPPRAWITLGRRLDDQAELWITGLQLAELWSVPVGTVQYWAHQDAWARIDGRPTRYLATDAQTTYDTRRGPGGPGAETATRMAVARAQRDRATLAAIDSFWAKVDKTGENARLARLRSVSFDA